MKRQYRLKKHATNEFTALTGIEAFPLLGGSECLITKHATRKGSPITRYAYCAYEGSPYFDNTAVEVLTTCKILNCIKKEHLIPSFHPSPKDLAYIKQYLKLDGDEVMAQMMKIPLSLFRSYIQLSGL